MKPSPLHPVSVFLTEDGALGVRLPWRMRYLIKDRVPASERTWVKTGTVPGYWRVTRKGYHELTHGAGWWLAPIPDDVLAYVQRIDDASTRLEAGVE